MNPSRQIISVVASAATSALNPKSILLGCSKNCASCPNFANCVSKSSDFAPPSDFDVNSGADFSSKLGGESGFSYDDKKGSGVSFSIAPLLPAGLVELADATDGAERDENKPAAIVFSSKSLVDEDAFAPSVGALTGGSKV